MRSGRSRFAGDLPTQEEKQKAYEDYLAYYGSFVIDEEMGTLTTLVEGATNTNWVGEKQVRYLELKDEKNFILPTPPLKVAGLELVGTFAWKRRG